MPTYTYRATNQSGNIIEDTLVSTDKVRAINDLQKLNYIILSIKEKKDSWLQKHFRMQPSISLLQKVIFFKHLSSMLEAGLTISESIDTLSQQTSNKHLQSILKETVTNLQNGLSLHYCLARYPRTFPAISLSMIQIGENAGNLNETLLYLSDQMEKSYDTRKKVIGAFIYPAIVLSLTVVLVLFLMTFTMPKITEILSSFKADLPTSTKIVMGMSNFLRNHLGLIGISTVAGIIGLKFLLRLPFTKPLIHKIYLELPIFGTLFKNSNISLFSRTFSSLIQSGIPIVKALHITSETLSNIHYQRAVEHASQIIEKGGTLADGLTAYPGLFPPIVSKMIAVGEKIGNLEKTSAHLAKLYEKEVDQSTKNLSTLLEPILLIFMGLSVGGIAVAIISPIYEISSSALG